MSNENRKQWDCESLMERLGRIGSAQRDHELTTINLIASDNAKPVSRAAVPEYPSDMIQEGICGARPFAGARLHDELENFVCDLATELFGMSHANVQPHSCSQANQAVYHALLRPGDTALSMSFNSGGHLTHGLNANFSGRNYRFVHAQVGHDGCIDYESMRATVMRERPKVLVIGASSYPRAYDGALLRRIADSVDAKLMLDLSHELGLIAGGAISSPMQYADVVTASTDKTLRGPFGGIILCRRELAGAIDRAVHPGTQSSFPLRRVALLGACLAFAGTAEFQEYAARAVTNAQTLAEALQASGVSLVTGGTDKHYVVADVRAAFGVSGQHAEARLEEMGILANRQTLPSDRTAVMTEAGGLRLGSPWITSRGYEAADVRSLADLILLGFDSSASANVDLRSEVLALALRSRPRDVWGDESPSVPRRHQVVR